MVNFRTSESILTTQSRLQEKVGGHFNVDGAICMVSTFAKFRNNKTKTLQEKAVYVGAAAIMNLNDAISKLIRGDNHDNRFVC